MATAAVIPDTRGSATLDASAGQHAAAPADVYLNIAGVGKSFRGTRVIEQLDLQVGRGEFVSLLGPSGCGKTTLLRLIAGLLRADAGHILLDGHDLTRLPAHKRNVGVVFQNYALFPHLNVADNVAFGLRARGLPADDIQSTVAQSLALVHMESFAERSVLALSGGQQQRVAVARALAVRPSLLLLDEPLSALDRKLRETMQIELRHLLRELAITAIFVTHDQDEALIMSDRIAVMNQGVIEQFDRPASIYMQPATEFVLDFVGTATRLGGTVANVAEHFSTVHTVAGDVRINKILTAGSKVTVAVRPENLALGAAPDESYNMLTLTLRDSVFMGSRLVLHFATDDNEHDRALAEVPPARAAELQPGAAVTLHWPVTETLAYPA